ncbi:lytic transglycosylase domain-containing protein [Actinoplanes sp. NPDC051861]|uniref:lytic transglycosylase domain-containing protein n=1 Tax=Actinoplanes sp. NPDC051861 TaxID=3155170 RepID=UPI0034339CDA
MGKRIFAAVVALVIAGGCGLGGKDPAPVAAPLPSSPSPSPSETPSEEPIEEPTAEPTPSKTKTVTKKASPTPTEDPNNFVEPPCSEHKGTEVSKKKVKAALKDAAGRIYWTNEAPTLKLNYPLVKAISWHESGWTSNIYNCDGGAGLMQVMPGTVDMINQRFGLTYDATKYQDNARVGANYLAWLTRYMSQKAYAEKTYDLSTAKCKTHSSWCLLNLVISAYQAGPDAVLANADSKTLPNPEYVDSVRALMKSCYCDRY